MLTKTCVERDALFIESIACLFMVAGASSPNIPVDNKRQHEMLVSTNEHHNLLSPIRGPSYSVDQFMRHSWNNRRNTQYTYV